jgi:hypothetical protein
MPARRQRDKTGDATLVATVPDPTSRFRFAPNRRQFLALSGAGLFTFGGRQGYDIATEMARQEAAWHAAADDNDTFLRKHAGVFRNVTIGTSFSPEQWRQAEGGDGEAMKGFRWMSEELGLTDVRLGLRWQRIEWSQGRIDLSQYGPFIDYALQRGMTVCLNVGPIRVFRSPEDHLPAWLASDPSLPGYQKTVREGTKLTGLATDYFARLLSALSDRFGAETLAQMPMVQVENEPFYPHRGHEWTLSQEYVANRVRQAREFFPRSKLLVGSAGRINLKDVRQFFLRLLSLSEEYRGRLVLGFNYHYKTPFRQVYPVINATDPITFTWGGYETVEATRKAARDIGYEIEVSEGQAEPNGNLTDPGNSARHFRFMLLRCADRVLDSSKPSVLRVWGIEGMARKALAGAATEEHAAMFDVMRRINESGPREAPKAASEDR